jgi:hypothetical protein
MPKAVDAASKDDTKTKDKRAVAGLQHGAPGVSHAIVEEPIIELERRDDDQCMIEEEKKKVRREDDACMLEELNEIKVRRNNAMADDMSLSPAKDTRSLEWVGTVAPNGEVYPYYGTMKVCSLLWHCESFVTDFRKGSRQPDGQGRSRRSGPPSKSDFPSKTTFRP